MLADAVAKVKVSPLKKLASHQGEDIDADQKRPPTTGAAGDLKGFKAVSALPATEVADVEREEKEQERFGWVCNRAQNGGWEKVEKRSRWHTQQYSFLRRGMTVVRPILEENHFDPSLPEDELEWGGDEVRYLHCSNLGKR